MNDYADWTSRFESMVDRQIRAAEENGAFDDLPGAGKPLPSEGQPYRPDWWVNQAISREKAGAYAIPPHLMLRAVAEELMGGARDYASERDVREAVETYNEQADRTRRLPQEGRAVVLPKLDPDEIVTGWREARSR